MVLFHYLFVLPELASFLLKYGNRLTTDILIDLASLASILAGGIGDSLNLFSTPLKASQPKVIHACATEPRLKLSFKFDPTIEDSKLKEIVNDILDNCQVPFTLVIKPVGEDKSATSSPDLKFEAKGKADPLGLFYRRPIPYLVSLVDGDNNPRQTELVLLPNKGPVGVIPWSISARHSSGPAPPSTTSSRPSSPV